MTYPPLASSPMNVVRRLKQSLFIVMAAKMLKGTQDSEKTAVVLGEAELWHHIFERERVAEETL